jgi:carbon-monoxide dehydrogenase medium subunit
MLLSDISFHSPKNLPKALKLLGELKNSRVVAGGTDLFVDIKQGLIEAKDIISLQRIKELKGIEKKDGKIQIGALTTPKEIISSALINRYIPALADAARVMASPQIRSMATIGGNIASAVPSADLPPSLIAADAILELRCSGSAREIPLARFFIGPRETDCQTGEVLTSISVPIPPPHTGISYQKFALRESNALAVVSVASRLTIKDGKIDKAVVVLGAVAPIPVIALKASVFLNNREPLPEFFEKASSMAAEAAKPISDIRGSVLYRKELVHILTKRSLEEVLKRVWGKGKRKKTFNGKK